MIDMEISLVQAFGWSLKDIDETDIESLLPWINRFAGTTGTSTTKFVPCDQVNWL